MEHPEQFLSNVFFILLILMGGCDNRNQKETIGPAILKNDERLQNQNGILALDDKPFTGMLYLLYHESGDTLLLESYLDGREHGEWKQFYSNNKLKEKRFFQNGVKIGEYKAWWPNGVLQLQYQFSKGEYSGECREWNSQGRLTRIMNYSNGHEEGEQKWWYDNGKIKANYIVKDGRRFGLLGTKNCINVSDSVFIR